MSKLENYLVTQAGTSTAVGGSVLSSSIGNFPAIGDILLSPNEKFSDLNRMTKFDLLLCDGSELDTGKYPQLAVATPDTEVTEPKGWLFSHSRVNAPVPSYDPAETDEPTWDYRFNNDGQHTYFSEASYTMFPIPEKTLDIEELGSVWGMIASLTWTSTMTNTGDMVFKDAEENIIYTINWFNTGTNGFMNISTAIGLGSADTKPTDNPSGNCQINGLFEYNSAQQLMVYTSLRAGNHVLSFTDSVDLDSVTHVVINGTAGLHASVSSAQTLIAIDTFDVFTEKYLPDMTSPDPSIPYRIIGDLT